MATRIAINGFGRIGRQVLRIVRERYPDELQVVAVNDLMDMQALAYLLRYDSVYGRFPGDVALENGALMVGGEEIKVYSHFDPSQLPWRGLGVDLVVEATGVLRDREKAVHHLTAGAKKVIITAPSKDPDLMVCLGVNQEEYDPEAHQIISNASCTTNCAAPVAKVLHERFGIRRGLLTTVHSYTNSQRLVDYPHKDLRRGRAAAINIVPTTTGAARAVARVIPDLEGRIDGFAMRVPTPTVSIVDFVAELDEAVTEDQVKGAFQEAEEIPEMKGILSYTEDPLVSSDFVGDPHSAIVDGPSTMVIQESLVKVVAWYDNEWGYATRVADLAHYLAQRGLPSAAVEAAGQAVAG